MTDERHFRAAFHRDGRTAGEIDTEFEFHLDARVRALVAQGWSPGAARVEAMRRFGDIEDARRTCEQSDNRRIRRMDKAEFFHELTQDAGYALRSLRKAPAFSFFAILTLALGIGANASIFSVVRGVLLRPMPFAAPGQLVTLMASYQRPNTPSAGPAFPYHSPANLLDIKSQNRSFSGLTWFTTDGKVLTGAGEPVQLDGADVSGDFFSVLGVRPLHGRIAFTGAEDAPNGVNVALLSEALWRDRFGADTTLVGRSVTLDNTPFTVLGVVPAASVWPAGSDFWVPLQLDASKVSRGAVYLTGIARLKPGVSSSAASADVRAIMARLAEAFPNSNKGLTTDAVDLREAITGRVDRPLLVLLGAVTLVLLIACANVANLLLVRGVARQGEMAVRAALGAGRGRITRQLVTENLVLAALGGALGTALAFAATRALIAVAPSNIPRLDAVHLDGWVLAAILAITVVTGLVFGLVPARQAARADVGATLREGGRGSRGGRASSRMRTTLVAAEVALAVMLVVGAGLLVKSFQQLMAVDPGFRDDNAASFSLVLPNASYPDPRRTAAFVDQLVAGLRATPGIRDAGAVLAMPLSGTSFGFSFTVAEHPPVASGDQPSAQVRVATPGFFTALEIPIVSGRGFTEADRVGAPKVALITETAAKRFFPGENPVGKHVEFGWSDADKQRASGEIVGVVRDVNQSSLARAAQPQFYLPFAQRPVAGFSVVVRTSGDVPGALRASRAAVAALDPSLALSEVLTLRQVVDYSVAEPRFYMRLLAAFALLALVLAAVGIYGVIAYVVGQRSREIGIRIALGASGGAVLRLVMRQGVAMAVVGVVIGIGGALALTRSMERLLFHVQPNDPATYGATIAVLVGAAALASLVPALRATRADPVKAMRAE